MTRCGPNIHCDLCSAIYRVRPCDVFVSQRFLKMRSMNSRNAPANGLGDLYAVTGGNPFFVTEALASQDHGVPVSVSDAVLSRLARLTPAARAVVELISVVPAKTELWLLNESISPTTAVLEECADAGILVLDNSSIGFRHELARRAVEDSLPAPRAQSMHAKVLKALLSRGADSQLARVVHHAAKSGDAAAVLEYAPIAARQAAALNAHRESASHYQTALKYADVLPPEQRADLLEHVPTSVM